MVVFPNCKINIGLKITGKREDGYHDLQTIFYPVAIKDGLEVIVNVNGNKNDLIFSSYGISIDLPESDNLCIKAYHLIKKDFPQLPSVKIHLHKNIPLGAGLGGGSADGAFMIKLLNDKFNLALSHDQQLQYALQLGSDCPFFIINKPSYATGRGELMEEIKLDLSTYKILLVNPRIHINTGWAFSRITPKATNPDLPVLAKLPPDEWEKNIYNDFEEPVFTKYPEIKILKQSMYDSGAIYASMSGSGSSVYGIFEKKAFPLLNFPAHYFFKWS